MMQLLIPLGLLGLLGVVALIIIYLIKPNFQQKFISSTFVWKLSLKYRKKKIPVNMLRNILLIICQILIITSCALILAKPVIAEETIEYNSEQIIIIDASANMRATHDEYATDGTGMYQVTRFEKAVEKAKAQVNSALSSVDGRVSVIIADTTARLLKYGDDTFGTIASEIRRYTPAQRGDVIYALDQLVSIDPATNLQVLQCSYGNGDIEGAIGIANTILEENPKADIILYSAEDYYLWHNVKDGFKEERKNAGSDGILFAGEWNAAILSFKAEVNDEILYTFTAEVAVYGRDANVTVTFTIYGANASDTSRNGYTVEIPVDASCQNNGVTTVVLNTSDYMDQLEANFGTDDPINAIISFKEAKAQITMVGGVAAKEDGSLGDSILWDNSYMLYGGTKPELKVQYVSSLPNPFVAGAVDTLKATLAQKWTVTSENIDTKRDTDKIVSDKGFDLYIFEHVMPTILPTDGVVILLDPEEAAPIGSGLRYVPGAYGNTIDPKGDYVMRGEEHPILNNVNVEDITVSRYTPMDDMMWGDTTHNWKREDEHILIKIPGLVQDYPILSVYEKKGEQAMVVFALSMHYSNLSVLPSMPILFMNIVNYFFPEATKNYEYAVGDSESYTPIGKELRVRAPSQRNVQDERQLPLYTEFPVTVNFSEYGTYTIYQAKFSDNERIETNIFVKPPSIQSNIFYKAEELPAPEVPNTNEGNYVDLLIWFAAALVALLFAEWWLQSRDQF